MEYMTLSTRTGQTGVWACKLASSLFLMKTPYTDWKLQSPDVIRFKIYLQIETDHWENLYNYQDSPLVIVNNKNIITCANNALIVKKFHELDKS